MAENTKEEKALSSLSNLTCPLCLDIFDDARLLTCGHTFCRKCLGEYDLSHHDRDHMVCPLCRKNTALMENRVDDLPTNVNVNGLVEDFYGKCGGANAVLEMRPKCTSCKFLGEAVSFCRTCSNYTCKECLQCHQRLTVFEGHEIISIEDIKRGSVSLGHDSEKCVRHKHEDKDLFCEECKVHGCLKCVILGHRDHKIKSHEDFEKELQLKVNDLIQRCAFKKSELETNIQNMEMQRHEVHAAMQKLRADVGQAYQAKVIQLEENQRVLLGQINALESAYDGDLNILKSKDRQKIKSICSSMSLVDNDRLGHLEMDSLSAHTLLCEELDGMLKETTDRASAAAITKKLQKKIFQPADVTRLDLGNISDKPEVEVIQYVELRAKFEGMTKYSDSSVGIGYRDADGIDIIDSICKKQPYAQASSDAPCYDLMFQGDKTLCISKGSGTKVHVLSPNGTRKSTIQVTSSGRRLRLNRSPSDEILITNFANHVYIYDPTGSTLKHTIPTKHNIGTQASGTMSGLIVTSSCYYSNQSIVTVYDRDGNAGKPLQAPSGIRLYAAVDEQDRVFVANVDSISGKVVIRLYDIDGLNLKERVQFNALNLRLDGSYCYLISLSPNKLVFACNKKLYFIKVKM